MQVEIVKSYEYDFAPQMAGLASLPGQIMMPTSAAITGSNVARGCRYICPRSGSLTGVLIPIGTSSGNICVGAYDTAATTRTRLATSGSVACPAGSTMAEVAFTTPVSVRRGQHIDLAFSADNATATFGRIAIAVAAHAVIPDGAFNSPDGGKAYLVWTVNSAFPLPDTIAENTIASGSNVYPMFGVIE